VLAAGDGLSTAMSIGHKQYSQANNAFWGRRSTDAPPESASDSFASSHRRRASTFGCALQCSASIPGVDYRRINAVPGLGDIFGRSQVSPAYGWNSLSALLTPDFGSVPA
jgi:hypothetical protein